MIGRVIAFGFLTLFLYQLHLVAITIAIGLMNDWPCHCIWFPCIILVRVASFLYHCPAYRVVDEIRCIIKTGKNSLKTENFMLFQFSWFLPALHQVKTIGYYRQIFISSCFFRPKNYFIRWNLLCIYTNHTQLSRFGLGSKGFFLERIFPSGQFLSIEIRCIINQHREKFIENGILDVIPILLAFTSTSPSK